MDEITQFRAEFDQLVKSMHMQLESHANHMFNLFVAKINYVSETNRARESLQPQPESGVQASPCLIIVPSNLLNAATAEAQLVNGQSAVSRPATSGSSLLAPAIVNTQENTFNSNHQIREMQDIKPEFDGDHIESTIADELLFHDDNLDDSELCDCTDCIKDEEMNAVDVSEMTHGTNELSMSDYLDEGTNTSSNSAATGNKRRVQEQIETSTSAQSSRTKRKRNHNTEAQPERCEEGANLDVHSIPTFSRKSAYQTDDLQTTSLKRHSNRHLPEKDETDQTKFYKTRRLDCLVDGCESVFAGVSQLDQHLLAVHLIYQFRCLRPGCGQSFETSSQLSDHHSIAHCGEDWRCYVCGAKLQNKNTLYAHFKGHHCRGIFDCPVEQCHFVGSLRRDMYNHYVCTHSQFRCRFKGCTQTVGSGKALLEHERSHTGTRPYRCKWPGCSKTYKKYSHTAEHVRATHFRLPHTKKQQQALGIVDDRDASEFVEVLHHLL